MLLCLFEGEVKTLRDAEGELTDTDVDVPWNTPSHRVVDIDGLASNIETHFTTFTAAQFALAMIEGVPKVRFINAG